MFTSRGAVSVWAVALVLAAALSSEQATAQVDLPPGYRLVRVTENNAYESFPHMNNRGQIVFTAWMDNTNWTTEEIFLYDSRSGVLTRLTNDNVADLEADINDDGVIVWSRGLGPEIEPGHFAGDIVVLPEGVGGPMVRLTDDDVDDFAPRINSLGQVVWQKSGPWACGGPAQDIWMYDPYLVDGSRVFPITSDATTLHVEHQSPVINDLGQIAWTRYDFCDPPPGWYFTSDTMLYSNGVVQAVTRAEQTQSQRPDINNRGQVVINSVQLQPLSNVIDIWESGQTTRFTDDGWGGVINERGDVLFERWDDVLGGWDMWLYRADGFRRLTHDRRSNYWPTINDMGESAWGSGNFPNGDIQALVRLPAGDLNCDGTVNQFDIGAFVTALGNPTQYDAAYPNCDRSLADVNANGSVNQFDIQSFVQLMLP